MKKMISLVLSLLLVTCLLVPDGIAEEENLNSMLAGNYYTYSFAAEGYGTYTYFFHFYEEAPVLGAVFYAGFTNNKLNYAGTYEVKAEEYAYSCYPDRETSQTTGEYTVGTAPYTIHFYDWNGEEIETCGFDGEVVYNEMTKIAATGSAPVMYYKDADPATSTFHNEYQGEIGLTFLSFISPEDETCTVELSHNMTYIDLMDFIIEGKWEMIAREDGGYDYNLIPDDANESPCFLSVAVDQKTAAYTNGEGTTYELINAAIAGPQVVYVGIGQQEMANFGTTADLTLNMYDDGSCTVEIALFGSQKQLDEGAYAMNADNTISFDFENAGELTGGLAQVDESWVMQLAYAVTDETLGEIEATLTLGRPTVEEAQPEIIFSFTGTYTTLDIYTNNTYEFAFASMGVTEHGTWEFDSSLYQFKLVQSNGNEIPAAIDAESHALTLTYVAEVNAQLADTFTADASVWGPALVK